MKWKCDKCKKYPEDPNPCYLERDTKAEMNVAVECPFYGDLECEFKEVPDISLGKIRARIISSKWIDLNAKHERPFGDDYLFGCKVGVNCIASLFLSEEEIETIEKRTEERFKKWMEKINNDYRT